MATAGETAMRPLLAVSTAIDLINEKIGYICNFLVLAACIVSAANAMIRYAFGYSSNGWLELQWYMFAILVMFGASYTFKRNEHVRVEIFYLFLTEPGRLRHAGAAGRLGGHQAHRGTSGLCHDRCQIREAGAMITLDMMPPLMFG